MAAHEDGSMTVFFDGTAPTLKDQLVITAAAEQAQKLRDLSERRGSEEKLSTAA
jgi:hypothetical protein